MPINMNFENDSMATARYSERYSVIPETEFEREVVNICHELAETLIRKNRDYGDSYRKLKLEYGDVALIFHVTEKLERLKTLQKQDNLVDESKSDTKIDAAGYCILDEACERVMRK